MALPNRSLARGVAQSSSEPGLGHPGSGQGPLRVGTGVSSVLDLQFDSEAEKFKKRAKADKNRYRRLLGRFKRLKKANESLSVRVQERVREVYESGLPRGWEQLASASDELARKFKLSVSNFEALLNQVSLARAVHTVTSLMSRLSKNSRIVYNDNLGIEERIRDYLSQAANVKRKEFEAPRPRPLEWDTEREMRKVEKNIADIDKFQKIVGTVTEFIARIENDMVTQEEISSLWRKMRDYEQDIPQEWMEIPFGIITEDFAKRADHWRRGGYRDEVGRSKKRQMEELDLRESAIERTERMIALRFLSKCKTQGKVIFAEKSSQTETEILNKERNLAEEERLSKIENMFSRFRR